MKTTKASRKEMLWYLLGSALTTAVSWAAYSLFVCLFERAGMQKTSVLIANILSWVCAVTFSFVFNKKRVFGSDSWAWRTVIPEMAKFFSSRFVIGLLEIFLVPALVSLGLNQVIFGVKGLWAKVIATPIMIILNYICGKFLVFRGKRAKE